MFISNCYTRSCLLGQYLRAWYPVRRLEIWMTSSTWKILGSSGVLDSRYGGSFSNTTEKNNLGNSGRRNVGKGLEPHTILEYISKGVLFRSIKTSWESPSEFLDAHTNKGNHGNTSMLDLHSTTTGPC